MKDIKIFYPKLIEGINKEGYSYLKIGIIRLGISVEIVEDSSMLFKDEKHWGSLMGFDVLIKNKKIRVWYDRVDSNLPFLKSIENNAIYFKAQFNPKYITTDKIYPIWATPSAPPRFLELLNKYRAIKKKCRYKYDIFALMNDSNNILRVRLVDLISQQKNWKSLYGIHPSKARRIVIPEYLLANRVDFFTFLEIAAQSKIVVGFPGNAPRVGLKDGHNKREIELTGIGTCWLGMDSTYPFPPGLHKAQISVKPDLSNFVEKVNYYLTHSEEREVIASNGLKYYEDYFSPQAQMKYIVNKVREVFCGVT